MSKITCTRRIQFCAGHRVLRHESKCANMHGHNYVAMIEAEAPQLDDIGRVIDFSVLKEIVGGWIEEAIDHGFLVYKEDIDVLSVLRALDHKYFVMSENPTAENIAALILDKANALLPFPIRAVHVRVWETENCFADAWESQPK